MLKRLMKVKMHSDKLAVCKIDMTNSQKEFIKNDTLVKFFCGTGCGKTEGLLLSTLDKIKEGKTTIGFFVKNQNKVPFAILAATDFYRKYCVDFSFEPRYGKITFKSGAVLLFLTEESEIRSMSFSLVLFEDIQEFNKLKFYESIYRLRNMSVDYKPQVLCSVIPQIDSWVFEFAKPYLDKDGKPTCNIGISRFFPKSFEKDSGELTYKFIFSDIFENTYLLNSRPNYLGCLKALSLKDRSRLLYNIWV